MSLNIGLLQKIKEIQRDFPQLDLDERKKFEDTAIAIVEENFGKLTRRQIGKLMDFLDMVFADGIPKGGRFGLLLRGQVRNQILANDLNRLNLLLLEIYGNENLDVADEYMSELNGVGDGFISCLLYLKDRSRYNVMIRTIERGLRKVFPNVRFEGSFKDRYQNFNKLVNVLRQKCNLQPQEVDFVLWRLSEE